MTFSTAITPVPKNGATGPRVSYRTVSKPIGRCIYCGTDSCRLSKEHVIPLSLNGWLLLPHASCPDCRDVTSDFERIVTREMYHNQRVRSNTRTRRPERRPQFSGVRVVAPEGEKTIEIPSELYPRLYPIFRLPVPGILEGREPIETNPDGVEVHLVGRPEDVDLLYERGYLRRGIDDLLLSGVLHWGAFNRLLAKIAHCRTIFCFGPDYINLYEPLLTDVILGRSGTYSHFIGGCATEPDFKIDFLLQVVPKGPDNYLVCKIFFIWSVDFPFPTYQVVVGKIRSIETFLMHISA